MPDLPRHAKEISSPAAHRQGRASPGDSAQPCQRSARGIAPGDEVVFARLDVAEALGIWRHETGRVVGIHLEPDAPPALDVAFNGHELLDRYVADLFEPAPRRESVIPGRIRGRIQ